MVLSDFLKYSQITIQCHDNPDADALASGFALYTYFSEQGKDVTFIYSGRSKVVKSNLLLMITELQIPVTFRPKDSGKIDGLLITVDCCYGEGNVTKFEADAVAVIDHHQVTATCENAEINPLLGSCSTLVWQMLLGENFDFSDKRKLNTALYYGLMTDTGNFVELHHPVDRDMYDELIYEKSLITLFCNSNISISDMVVAGKALINYRFLENLKCSIIRAEACDPNILGLISDLTLQVDKFDECVVFCELSDGYKISVRSCVKTLRANEFARFITADVGSGGGHIDKAGGFIYKEKVAAINPDISIEDYLENRIRYYFELCVIYDVNTYVPDITGMKKYEKNRFLQGYADPSEFVQKGSQVTIRTLEGDLEMNIDGSYFIMIGLKGEVYPIKKEKFYKTYDVVDEPYDIITEYIPTLHCHSDGVIYKLSNYARSCWTHGGSRILARELDNITKIFTAWDRDNYYVGNPGDFLACREEDPGDIYIIERNIFFKTYSAVL